MTNIVTHFARLSGPTQNTIIKIIGFFIIMAVVGIATAFVFQSTTIGLIFGIATGIIVVGQGWLRVVKRL